MQTFSQMFAEFDKLCIIELMSYILLMANNIYVECYLLLEFAKYSKLNLTVYLKISHTLVRSHVEFAS